jgi:hypothetical protein
MKHLAHRVLLAPMVFALGYLLAATAAHAEPPPSAQTSRFAAEGRADLTRLQLANGHGAKATISVLCRVASQPSPQQTSPGYLRPSEPPPSPADPLILKVIEIPTAQRGTLRLRFETDDRQIRESVYRAAGFLSRVVASASLPTSEIRVLALNRGESRAYSTGLGTFASVHFQPGVLDVGTAVHELAHHIEGDHRPVLENSRRFIARRARGGSPERLRDLTGQNYGVNEIAYRANWTTRGGSHYSGKFYGPSLKNAIATELISVGLERLRREPAVFFREDSDYFLFLLLVLQAE